MQKARSEWNFFSACVGRTLTVMVPLFDNVSRCQEKIIRVEFHRKEKSGFGNFFHSMLDAL